MPHPQGSGEGRLLPLQAALQLAEEYGYQVFPCNADKAPLTPHGFKDATSNREKIIEWWEQNPEALVGVPTGQVNKLYVIDVDPDGMPWYEAHREGLTYWRIHRTRRQGVHLLYQIRPEQKYPNTASKIAPGVDTRGEGGYVIWWPAAGLEVWTDGGDENAAPPVAEAKSERRKANGGGNGQFKEGARHGALLRFASKLRHAGVNGEPLLAALLAWNLKECDPPQDEAEVRRIAADYSAKPEDRELAQQLEDAGHTNLRFMTALATAEIVEKRPVVDGFLYPGAHVFVGRPKIGKSWCLLQLAIAVAEGGTFLGYHCRKAQVLAIFGEDDDARIKKRLQRMGVVTIPDGIYLINRDELTQLPEQFPALTFTQWLDRWLTEHPRVKLVLLDTETTIRQIWTGQCESDHVRVTDADYQATRTYDTLALHHGAAFLLVNHASKLRGQRWTDPHELINRSMTAVAGASGSIVLADPPDADLLDGEQSMRVLGIRGRDLERDVLLAVHQDKDLAHFISDGPYVEVRQTQAETECLQPLEQNPGVVMSATEIGQACGKRAGTVNRTLSRMLAKGRDRWKQYRLVSKRGKDGGYRLDVVE